MTHDHDDPPIEIVRSLQLQLQLKSVIINNLEPKQNDNDRPQLNISRLRSIHLHTLFQIQSRERQSHVATSIFWRLYLNNTTRRRIAPSVIILHLRHSRRDTSSRKLKRDYSNRRRSSN